MSISATVVISEILKRSLSSTKIHKTKERQNTTQYCVDPILVGIT